MPYILSRLHALHYLLKFALQASNAFEFESGLQVEGRGADYTLQMKEQWCAEVIIKKLNPAGLYRDTKCSKTTGD